MSDLLALARACALGCAAGVAYFAGLWVTLRALPAARHPAVILFGSFVVRFGGAAAVFLLLVRAGGLAWIVSGLAGFVLARTAIVRRLAPSGAAPPREAR